MNKLIRFTCLAFFGVALCQTAFAQEAHRPAYRTVYKTVYETQAVTAYRLEYETIFEEREITVQKPVWETEMRERRYTVAKPLIETSEREERYTVLKPVWETSYRDESYDRVKLVNETEMREERVIVNRPVWEDREVEQQHTVRKAVVETAMQDRSYTTYDPVTSMQTEYVQQNNVVSNWVYSPGAVSNRLQFAPGGYVVDPATGLAYWQRGGLTWVPTIGAGTYGLQQQIVPSTIAVQRPVVSMVPRTVTEQQPVQVTRYVDEVVVQKVPVRVLRTEQCEEVRQVPVTVQKQVVERIEKQVPVQTLRYERQEMVRKVPVTTQKVVYEERVEQMPVQVYKVQTELRKVQEPKTVAVWKPFQTTQQVPRTVVMQVPVDPCGVCRPSSLPTTTYYPVIPSAPPAPPAPPAPQAIITQRPASEPAKANSEQDKAVDESVLKKSGEPTPAKPAETPAVGANEPKDTDPTGKPALKPIPDPAASDLNSPTGEEAPKAGGSGGVKASGASASLDQTA